MENLRTAANRAQAVLDAGRLLQRASLEDRSAVTRRLVILEERAAIYASSADSVTRRHFTAADADAPAIGGDLASAISAAALDIYVSGVVLGGAALREGSPNQLGPSLARLSAAVVDAQTSPGAVRFFASNDTFGATSVIEATGMFQKAVDELLTWLVKESAKTVAVPISSISANSALQFVEQIQLLSGIPATGAGPVAQAISVGLGGLQSLIAFISKEEFSAARQWLTRLWEKVGIDASLRWVYDIGQTKELLQGLKSSQGLALGPLNASAGQLIDLRQGFARVQNAVHSWIGAIGVVNSFSTVLALAGAPGFQLLSTGAYAIAVALLVLAGRDFAQDGRFAPEGRGVRGIIAAVGSPQAAGGVV